MIGINHEIEGNGEFRKRKYKTTVSFTIDEDLLNEFRNYCKKNGLNVSGKVEKYMRDEIKRAT